MNSSFSFTNTPEDKKTKQAKKWEQQEQKNKNKNKGGQTWLPLLFWSSYVRTAYDLAPASTQWLMFQTNFSMQFNSENFPRPVGRG